MDKETFYFSHDYNARNDPDLSDLLMKLGMEGIGIYWCIVEMLYEQNGYLNLDKCESYAFALHTQCDKLKAVIQSKGLFNKNGTKFWSESVLRRLARRKDISEKASKSAKKRWDNTKAMPTQCEGNAIRVNKIRVNKSKVKENNYPDYFNDWLEYKKEKKQGYKSDKSIQTCYNHLCELSNNDIEVAKKIIEQSVANNWAGLFELKNNNNGKSIISLEQTAENLINEYGEKFYKVRNNFKDAVETEFNINTSSYYDMKFSLSGKLPDENKYKDSPELLSLLEKKLRKKFLELNKL